MTQGNGNRNGIGSWLAFLAICALGLVACGGDGTTDDDATGDAGEDAVGDVVETTETGDEAATGEDGTTETVDPCEYLECGGTCCEAGQICEGGACSAEPAAYPGYTLYSPMMARETFLIDMAGTVVHQWSHAGSGGYPNYLLGSGHLLRAESVARPTLMGGGGATGLIQELAWDGSTVWSFECNSATELAHHDIEPMPTGNVLLIVWEVKSATEAAAAGRTSARTMWPDKIVEIRPEGSSATVVWEWHSWDHLVQDADATKANYGVVADHPELLDVNLGASSGGPPGGSSDWLHINGVSYDPVRDRIAISSHFMNEVYVIDHSTTTEEAAGHAGGGAGRGGDILYRWGSPSNYDAPGAAMLDVAHCAWWVPADLPGAGHLMVFNNNEGARASEALELELPLLADGTYAREPGAAFGPAAPVWSYSDGATFYSQHLGANQRLPNGNTFLLESTDNGHMLEVATDGTIVWEFTPAAGEVARALRYGTDYPGVAAL